MQAPYVMGSTTSAYHKLDIIQIATASDFRAPNSAHTIFFFLPIHLKSRNVTLLF